MLKLKLLVCYYLISASLKKYPWSFNKYDVLQNDFKDIGNNCHLLGRLLCQPCAKYLSCMSSAFTTHEAMIILIL